MTKTVSKHFLTIDVLNILNWMEKKDGFILTAKLPIKIQWEMNKNLIALNEIRNTYNDFNQKLEQEYSDDEHAEDSINKNGESIREVKEKYREEFIKAKNEILATENDVNIRQFNIKDFGDINIDLPDMAMLSIFIIDEEKNKDENIESEVV